MKILSLANKMKSDIAQSGIKLKNASTDGYKIAERNAKIYNLGNVHRFYNISRSISDKVIQNTTVQELPYIAGAIGLIIPFPLACPILMGVGFLLRLCMLRTGESKQPTPFKSINYNA